MICALFSSVMPVTELFGNGTVSGQNIFGCVEWSVARRLHSK